MNNSVMTGAWLRTLDARLPLLAGAVLLGLVFGLTFFGRALWIVATGTVLAICVAGLACFAYAGLVLPWILPASAFFLTAMTIFVERSKAERGHRLRMEAELETAGLVQRAFFPKQTQKLAAVQVVGHCRPATQCGGDWWWHFSPAPGVELVLIGDVTGHGTPAALVTSALYSAVCTMIDLHRSNAGVELSPARILQSLNHMLFEALGGERLVTMFVACFDTNNGMLTYGNSAHHFPLVFRRGERINFEAVRPGSMLGVDATGTFPEGKMALRPGDKYVLYTDGITECSTADGKPLGRRGFATMAAQHAHAEARSMAQGLAGNLGEVFGDNELEDDCTFVIVEIPASGQTLESASA
jgi:serine phosphatase RsbU (regulator of sigma subunit)